MVWFPLVEESCLFQRVMVCLSSVWPRGHAQGPGAPGRVAHWLCLPLAGEEGRQGLAHRGNAQPLGRDLLVLLRNVCSRGWGEGVGPEE